MEASNESQIKDFIEEKEKTEGNGAIIDTIGDLVGLEKETRDGALSKWLKNDENLLQYAKLSDKSEKLNIGESIKFKLLEVKLSITCPYFADFKSFLKEINNRLPHTETEAAPESVETGNHMFCGTNVENIKSEPFEKNSETGVTWCSKTARCNGYNFGISLPAGNAYDAGKLPGKDSLQTIPKDKFNKTPQKSREGIEDSRFKNIKQGNYADIYTDAKSNYGHRAAAFKDDSGQRYVLDPYTRVNGKLDSSPKKLEDYLKVKKIVKAHFYQSNGYIENHSDVHKDKGTGYEWGTK